MGIEEMAKKVRTKQKNMPKNTDTKIYHRLARYPVYPVSARKKIVQKVDKGTIIMQSSTPVSVENFEKLFVLLHLIQTNKAEVEFLQSEKFEGKEFVLIRCRISEIGKVLNSNDYEDMVESFAKLTFVNIIYDLVNFKGKERYKIITHPILSAEHDIKNNTILVSMEKFFYEVCLEKSMCINIKHFVKLSPIAKNMYFFMVANLDKEKYDLNTICQRCNLIGYRPSDARKKIRKALSQIRDITKLIRDFKVEKDTIYISKNIKALER